MDRDAAVDLVEDVVETVETDPMPVPVREIWVFGDVALGLDPVDRLDVYLTKDVLLRDDDPDASGEFEDRLGVKGVGRTVRTAWATEFPEFVRARENGYVAPERCLAAHLLPEGEPVHLEVCNTGFEDNVTQRLKGARAHEAYEELLDPRAVCLWVDGQRSPSAFEKLREGELVFPTLADALEMIGMDADEAVTAAQSIREYRAEQSGTTVRGDVV